MKTFMALLSAIGARADDAVLDLEGEELRPGVEYYILPVMRGRGGGLNLASRNGSSPLNVARENSEVSNGLPLTFQPVTTDDKVIRVWADAKFVFSAATICVQSTMWRLRDVDSTTRKLYVTTGGQIGNPRRSTVSNLFKIEKDRDDYKLVFCPSVCNMCRVICGNVGIFNEYGKRWLGLKDEPLAVMFVSNTDPSKSSALIKSENLTF